MSRRWIDLCNDVSFKCNECRLHLSALSRFSTPPLEWNLVSKQKKKEPNTWDVPYSVYNVISSHLTRHASQDVFSSCTNRTVMHVINTNPNFPQTSFLRGRSYSKIQTTRIQMFYMSIRWALLPEQRTIWGEINPQIFLNHLICVSYTCTEIFVSFHTLPCGHQKWRQDTCFVTSQPFNMTIDYCMLMFAACSSFSSLTG